MNNRVKYDEYKEIIIKNIIEFIGFLKVLLGNAASFVLIYTVFMIPTYILPYFGSNSSIMITGWLYLEELSSVPQFLMHIFAMFVLILITWLRGVVIHKKWIVIFPVIATVYDFTPGLSVIPLVPTVMHLLAMTLGVINVKPPASPPIS